MSSVPRPGDAFWWGFYDIYGNSHANPWSSRHNIVGKIYPPAAQEAAHFTASGIVACAVCSPRDPSEGDSAAMLGMGQPSVGRGRDLELVVVIRR